MIDVWITITRDVSAAIGLSALAAIPLVPLMRAVFAGIARCLDTPHMLLHVAQFLNRNCEKIGLPVAGGSLLGMIGQTPVWSLWLGAAVSFGMLVTAISREIRGWLDRRHRAKAK